MEPFPPVGITDDNDGGMHWEAAAEAASSRKIRGSETALDKTRELARVRTELRAVKFQIEDATRQIEARKTSYLATPLSAQERLARAEKIAQLTRGSESRSADPEMTERLRQAAGKVFDEGRFKKFLDELPETSELRRLERIQSDLEYRLGELELGQE